MVEIERFLTELNRQPPATEAAIRECEQKLGLTLPAEYVQFLRLTNGGEGFIGENASVMFWRVEDLLQQNEDYEFDVEQQGLLAFGSNGGDEAFAFDVWTPNWAIVETPFLGDRRDDAWPMAASFNRLLERLYEVGGAFGEITTLSERTRTVFLVDASFSIYAAEPWTAESRASFWLDDKGDFGGSSAMREEGLKPFLTVAAVQHFLAAMPDRDNLSTQEQCERLIAHARQFKEG